jgi:hypothetical protein
MFVFTYSVLAQLEYAFIPDVHLVLAKPWPHLVLDGSDCIDFGIALLDDCLDVSLSFYGALRAYGFICGYLDIGTQPRRPLARLPRPRLQHPPLSASSISTQGPSPCMSTPRLPL